MWLSTIHLTTTEKLISGWLSDRHLLVNGRVLDLVQLGEDNAKCETNKPTW